MLKLIFLFIFIPFETFASIKVLSLNLHGYHPMQEERRFQFLPTNKISYLPSHLFYFTEAELKRGNKLREKLLSQKIRELEPDFVLLQEVGAGAPQSDKSCKDFYLNNSSDWVNTATSLKRELPGYKEALACRGNIGWFTNDESFKGLSIYKNSKHPELVFKNGDNPYPKGVLIEGFAILFKKNFELEENALVRLPYNKKGQEFAFQLSILRNKIRPQDRYVVINIHAGHKIVHFEQALALRHYLKTLPQGHLIIGGDFNAGNDLAKEASMVPWYIKNAEYDFDLHHKTHQKLPALKKLLEKTNNSAYKPWATISDPLELDLRLDEALSSYQVLFGTTLAVLAEAEDSLNCKTSCVLKDRIDYIFASSASVKRFFFLGDRYFWSELDFYSDHAAVFSEFIFQGFPQKY